ncbi:NAD(P)H-binding protein [Spirillospora sp. NPDC050679]
MTVLVTGATGSVGRVVVDRLREAGEPVRALTRDAADAGLPDDVEVFQGDLLRPETLAPALEGVDRLYLFPVHQTAPQVAEAIARAGVRRVVVLSSDAVGSTIPTNKASADEHGAVERAVAGTGAEWTALRPFGFAGNALFWAHSIATEGVVRMAYPTAAQSLVHEADIAEVAVAALLEDGHAGRVYRLSGPEAITQEEQVRIIAEVVGRPIEVVELTPEQKRAEMAEWIPEDAVDMILGYFAVAVERPDEVLPTVEQVLGKPARTFAQWARDHAADFG